MSSQLLLEEEQQIATFATDVKTGLSSSPKHLNSKYFYDEIGDRIFQQIMKMPEYYPTDAEFEIFSQKKADLLTLFQGERPFQLIEFGAGDGTKTKVLIDYFLQQKADFSYLPIDISGNVLELLETDLEARFPQLEVQCFNNDYFEALHSLESDHDHRKVVFFLGGNIGNFMHDSAVGFLSKIRSYLSPGDLLLVGVDLKKDPHLILNAYDDPAGITSAFNLNLLTRINKELGGNFNLNFFKHYATYDPLSGDTKSYLISQKKQTVQIDALEASFDFDYAEPIYMELSKKYSIAEIEELAKEAGFSVATHLFDCKHYFTDTIWEVK